MTITGTPREMLDRLPPHSADAERCVLGSVLRDNDCLDDLAQIVRTDDFYADAHQKLYATMLGMRGRPGGRIDLVLLAEELKRRGWFEDAGGYPYLAELWDAAPTAVNADHYARIVHDKALLRAVVRAGYDMVKKAMSPGADGAEALREAERAVFALAEIGVASRAYTLREAVEEAVDRINALTIEGGSQMSGLPTGLTELDELLGGLQPSELIVVAARPSIGKTSAALAFVRHAIREGRSALFASIEQSRVALATRLLCAESGVNGRHIRAGRIGDAEARQLGEARDALIDQPMVIDDAPEQNVLRIAATARRLKRQGKLDLVVVDYLQLVSSDRRRDPRHEQVAEISRRLKALARELEVPVLALAQLNRESEKRGDAKPRLSDLRESAQIEQDADVVMLLHRPDKDKDDLEIIVAKHRDGPTGDVMVCFNRESMRFSDRDRFPAGPTPFADA